MWNRSCTLFFYGMLSAVLAQLPTALWAQTKGPSTKPNSPLKFEVYEDSAKEYRWRLVEGNDKDRQVLATGGQGYKAKADCLHEVKSIQQGIDKLKFETYLDRAQKNRWRAKASNGQEVAASGSSYKTKAECEEAVQAMKKVAPKATIEQITKGRE